MTLQKIDLRDLTGVIRMKRRELGLTQKELGARLGIDQRTVSALEKNPGSISSARLFAVLGALELQLYAANIQEEVVPLAKSPNGGNNWSLFKNSGAA